MGLGAPFAVAMLEMGDLTDTYRDAPRMLSIAASTVVAFNDNNSSRLPPSSTDTSSAPPNLRSCFREATLARALATSISLFFLYLLELVEVGSNDRLALVA